jgi:hypothetical protein
LTGAAARPRVGKTSSTSTGTVATRNTVSLRNSSPPPEAG